MPWSNVSAEARSMSSAISFSFWVGQLCAQLELEDLSARAPRERVDHFDPARELVAGQSISGELAQLFQAQRLPGGDDDHGGDRLPPTFVGRADDRHVRHRGV